MEQRKLQQLGKSDKKSDRHTDSLALPTYPDVGGAALGTFGTILAWFGVIAMSLGVCGSYMVFICSTLPALTRWGDQTLWVVLVLPLITVLSWMRHVSYFALTSSFGVLALVAAVIICTVDATLYGHHNASIDWSGDHALDANLSMPLLKIPTYPLFLGNAGFVHTYVCLCLPALLPSALALAMAMAMAMALALALALTLVLSLRCVAVTL